MVSCILACNLLIFEFCWVLSHFVWDSVCLCYIWLGVIGSLCYSNLCLLRSGRWSVQWVDSIEWDCCILCSVVWDCCIFLIYNEIFGKDLYVNTIQLWSRRTVFEFSIKVVAGVKLKGLKSIGLKMHTTQKHSIGPTKPFYHASSFLILTC